MDENGDPLAHHSFPDDESLTIDEDFNQGSIDNLSAVTLDDSTTKTSSYKKFSDFHLNISRALRQSLTLCPEYVEVVNESYSYAMRKKLRPKRAMALITKPHTSNGLS